MQNIWFTSDLHAYQKNICAGSTSWIDEEGNKKVDECRDFRNEIEMTETLIQNINNSVQCDDILYCLGDWSFGGRENIWRFRRRLNVKQLHLVLGNHDNFIDRNVEIVTDSGRIRARNLFSSVNQYIDDKIGGQKMFLCHYSLRVWHKASRGAWNLYGHSHGNLPAYARKDGKLYKCMDVGIDTHPEFRPYSFDELVKEFSNDKYIELKEDHHK